MYARQHVASFGLFLFGEEVGGGGGRRLTLALRRLLLRGLPRAEHEMVYGHGPLGHHIFAKIRFGI